MGVRWSPPRAGCSEPGQCRLHDDRLVPFRTAPLAVNVAGKDEVYVGRIREDRSIDTGLNLWVVADNLRKGSALNAIQIAEILDRSNV